MSTELGPLKDGEANTPFYGNGPYEGGNGSWTVQEDDAPNFKVPAQLSGSTLTGDLRNGPLSYVLGVTVARPPSLALFKPRVIQVYV